MIRVGGFRMHEELVDDSGMNNEQNEGFCMKSKSRHRVVNVDTSSDAHKRRHEKTVRWAREYVAAARALMDSLRTFHVPASPPEGD